MVARGDGLDPRPDLLDDAGRLVAQHDGQGMRGVARDHVVVAVADAVRRPAHLHLVRAGLEQLDVFDHERFLHVVEDGRGHAHGIHPSIG